MVVKWLLEGYNNHWRKPKKMGEEPPLDNNQLNNHSNKHEYHLKYHGVFWGWLFGNVFGHPKNLLDFKRPIRRSCGLGIF